MDGQVASSGAVPILPTLTDSEPEGVESSTLGALSMYSSATNNNSDEMIPEAFRDIYLVAINNEEEVEFVGLDQMFYAIFENDGSESQRNEMKEKIRIKCNEEFKTISLHIVLKSTAEIRATVRLKGTCNRFFDSSEDVWFVFFT